MKYEFPKNCPYLLSKSDSYYEVSYRTAIIRCVDVMAESNWRPLRFNFDTSLPCDDYTLRVLSNAYLCGQSKLLCFPRKIIGRLVATLNYIAKHGWDIYLAELYLGRRQEIKKKQQC